MTDITEIKRDLEALTARTLEEIEALAAEATPGPWDILKGGHVGETNTVREITFGGKYGGAWIQSAEQCGDEGTTGKEIIANAALIAALPDLLAIAQEQKAQIAMLQDNASTAAFDKIADQLGEANRENEEQRAELARRPRVGSCVWTMPDLTDRSFWSSTCGHEWQFLDGSPSENDAKFCPFCGGEIEEDVGEQR